MCKAKEDRIPLCNEKVSPPPAYRYAAPATVLAGLFLWSAALGTAFFCREERFTRARLPWGAEGFSDVCRMTALPPKPVDIMMLTMDSITGGNRERDLRTGFSIPFSLTLAGMLQFAIKPMWAINYATHERFRLPQLDEHVDMSGGALSIGRYFTEMLDPSMNWDDVAEMVRTWNGQFCLKGVMSAADAKRAVEIGCTGIVVSNHGGRQLDGSRASFDQLAEIVDAVGDRIDVLMDGGVQRGTHVLKALSVGAKAVGVGPDKLASSGRSA